MVPETKGLSLEQMDFLFEKRVATRQFRHFKFSHAVLADEQAKEAMVDDKEGNVVSNVEMVGDKKD